MESTCTARKRYPSDVSDDEWAFVAPYLTLMTEAAPQRKYPPREVFNGLRYIVKTGGQWRWMPHDLPPWPMVYQQTQRWLAAGSFEALLHDLREVLRLAPRLLPAPAARVAHRPAAEVWRLPPRALPGPPEQDRAQLPAPARRVPARRGPARRRPAAPQVRQAASPGPGLRGPRAAEESGSTPRR